MYMYTKFQLYQMQTESTNLGVSTFSSKAEYCSAQFYKSMHDERYLLNMHAKLFITCIATLAC